MSYHDQIEAAVEYAEKHAPSLEDFSSWPKFEEPEQQVTSLSSKFAFLYGQPDNAPLIFTQRSEKEPSEVLAKAVTKDEYELLFKTSAEVLGNAYEEDEIREYFDHESQHLIVASRLGAVGSKMGIAYHVLPKPDGKGLALFHQPMLKLGVFRTTKLGAALICSYPDTPSADDKRDVLAMGYKSIEDVAEHIIRRKRAPYYPLPRSYELSTASRGLRCSRWLQTHIIRGAGKSTVSNDLMKLD